MANRLKGEVEVELEVGGKKRTLTFRLGINELISLQDALGLKDDDEKFLLQLDRMKNSIRKLRLGVQAALLAHQPGITEEEAGEIITELGFRRIGALFDEALSWAMPEPTPTKAVTGKVAAGSPGVRPS